MARKFDGNLANYFSSTLAYDFPSDWTILLRIKNVVSTGDHQIFIGRRGGDTNGWGVGRQSSGQFTFWGFGGTTGSAGNVTLGSAGFEAYAITRAATGSMGTFYKDSTTPLGTASITPGNSATQGLYVGGLNNSGSAVYPANCELAEIAIFSRVLNSTELGQWFSGDSPSLYNTGLVHYWTLDAASGNESATTGGATLTQVGTVTATTHPAMNYGGSGASASGGTGTSTGSGSGGTATGGAAGTGSFTSDAMENNTGAGLLATVSVVWTWYQGAIGVVPTSTTHGTATTSAGGILSLNGLPLGAGFLLARTADSSGVYYQPGTVT